MGMNRQMDRKRYQNFNNRQYFSNADTHMIDQLYPKYTLCDNFFHEGKKQYFNIFYLAKRDIIFSTNQVVLGLYVYTPYQRQTPSVKLAFLTF